MKSSDIRENDELDRIMKQMQAQAEKEKQRKSPEAQAAKAKEKERRGEVVKAIRKELGAFLAKNPKVSQDDFMRYAEDVAKKFPKDKDLVDSIKLSMYHAAQPKPKMPDSGEAWASYGKARQRGDFTSKDGWTGD